MAFFELVLIGSKLRKLKETLVEEKSDAIKISINEKPRRRFWHIGVALKLAIRRIIKKILYCYCCEKFCFKLRHDGSWPNYILKSIVGFISGFLLTYIFFMIFVFQLSFTLSTATIMCAILGSILTIGLAFSTTIRCIVLLTLPQFFSQRGRQALLAYTFILAISGPVLNTLNNMGILSESLACGQEQLKSAVKQIVDIIKKPFVAIKDAIKKVVKTVKEIIKKIKEILLKIKRIIMAILMVIKATFQFLGKIISICNKEIGTPFERCTRMFENAILDCNAKLGPLFNWLCSITYLVKGVCYLVKIFDYICILIDFISDSIIGVVVRKVKTFIRHVRTMFYVRIKFSHTFEFQTITSRTWSEVAREIVAEIKERTRVLVAVFQFLTSAATLFFLFIVFRVIYYRYRYLTSESYDNRYITKDFRALDLRRAKLSKETVLPLNKREAQVYVSVDSNKLAADEKKAVAKAATTLATASIKLAILMAADYCLYWILDLIKYYGRFQSKVQAPNMPEAHITGNGLLADLLRSVVKAFQPMGVLLEVDTVPCLPNPIPPDYDRYVQIATTMLLCWFLTLAEPYGLRLRHIVMSYYHPTRARQRAIWLYNHVMRSRNSFLTFARRQLRRKALGTKGIEKITCKEYLTANLTICRYCLGEQAQVACLLCGEVFRESDDKKPIKCQTPGCLGVYCEQCYADLQNLCTVCLSPIEYGDLSDISEEKDSSDEEPRKIFREDGQSRQEGSWCCRICKRCFGKYKTEEFDAEDYSPKPKKKEWGKRKPDDKKSEDEIDLLHNTDEEEEPKNTNPDVVKDESDSSTDHSYSYQYDKSQQTQPVPNKTEFIDVEKQEIPDYASMETFREETPQAAPPTPPKPPTPPTPVVHTCICRPTYIKISDVATTQVDHTCISRPICSPPKLSTKTVSTTISGAAFIKRKKRKLIHFGGESRRSKEEETELLYSSARRSESGDGEPVQYDKGSTNVRLPTKNMAMSTTSQLESVSEKSSDENEDDKKSDSSTDSEVRGARHLKVMITREDLSHLTGPCSCAKYTDSVFSNVTYDEISESPRSNASVKTVSSASTVISLLRDRPVDSPGEGRAAKPRDAKSPNEKAIFEIQSSDSIGTYNFGIEQRKKIREYYKSVKDIASSTEEDKHKPNKLTKFMRRIFSKRKRNLDVLPLHETESEEITELRTYVPPPSNWDTISARASTPREPTSSANTVSGTDYRERGGESNPTRNSYRIVKANKIKEIAIFAKQSKTGDVNPFSCISAEQPTTLITRELLSKHFFSEEDLTPTRDCDIPMQALEAQTIFIRNKESSVKELPEKDATRSPSTESETKLATPTALGVENVQNTSSSNLSESLCKSILGVPSLRLRKSPTSDDIYDVQRKLKQVKLSGICETEVSEKSIHANRTRQSKCKLLKSNDNLRSQTQENQEASRSQSDKKLEIKDGNLSSQSSRSYVLNEQKKLESDSQKSSCCSHKHKGLKACPSPIVKLQCISDDTRITYDPDKGPSCNTDRMCACGTDKYPVREKEITVELRQKHFFTTNKMQQTSDNDICCSSPTSYPTMIDSSAIACTLSESTRVRTTFVESTDTDPQLSSAAYCSCRLSDRQSSERPHGFTCRKCMPPPPPRYEDYVNLQDRNCRSPRNKSSAKYTDCIEKYVRDESSDYTTVRDNSTSTRRSTRDSPVDTGYSLRESQYNEFRKDPPVSFTTGRTRRRRASDSSDGPRHRNKSASIIICACGDCRRCQRKRSPHSYNKYHSSDFDSTSSEVSDEESDNEDYDESQPACYELPYQNNDDYLELVQELEETLQSRNRNRVRRAMQEFEHRSKYNKPLEKPIIDYDETSESEHPIIKKISQLTEKSRCCGRNKCTCRRKRSSRFKAKEKQRPQSGGYPCAPRYRHVSPSESRKTHWQMDSKSGEWYKVSGNNSRSTETSPPRKCYCPYECNCFSTKSYNFR